MSASLKSGNHGAHPAAFDGGFGTATRQLFEGLGLWHGDVPFPSSGDNRLGERMGRAPVRGSGQAQQPALIQ